MRALARRRRWPGGMLAARRRVGGLDVDGDPHELPMRLADAAWDLRPPVRFGLTGARPLAPPYARGLAAASMAERNARGYGAPRRPTGAAPHRSRRTDSNRVVLLDSGSGLVAHKPADAGRPTTGPPSPAGS